MICIEEKSGVTPLCPHCSVSLERIFYRELRGFLGRRYIYFCPQCNKVLGVSHRFNIYP